MTVKDLAIAIYNGGGGMPKKAIVLLITIFLLVVSGCGGGSGSQITSATSVALSIDKTQAIASNQDQVTVTATVEDGNGVRLAGRSVFFNVPAGTYPYMSPVQTDVNGVAKITLRHPPVGPNFPAVVTVTATTEGITSNAVTATFSNPPQVPAVVTLSADKLSLAITDRVTLTATATDANGAPIAGQAFNATVQPQFLAAIKPYTNEAGQATITIYPNIDGGVFPTSVAVSAMINGTQSNVVNIAVTIPNVFPQLP